jgi:hypothetical protein
LSINQLIDITADVLGSRHPIKTQIPHELVGALSPLIERVAKYPKGVFKGLLDAAKIDMLGDLMPNRALLPSPLMCYRKFPEHTLQIRRSGYMRRPIFVCQIAISPGFGKR